MTEQEPICGHCGARGSFSPVVAHVTVYSPSLPDGFFCLMPDMDLGQRYRLCGKCRAPEIFLLKAMEAHRKTRDVIDWTAATFVFVDCAEKPWHIDRPHGQIARA